MSRSNSNSTNFTNINTNNYSNETGYDRNRINMSSKNKKKSNTEIKSFYNNLKSMVSTKEYERIKIVASKKATYYRHDYLINEIVSFLLENAVSIRIVQKLAQGYNFSHTTRGDPLPTYVYLSIKNIKYIKYINKYFLQIMQRHRGSYNYSAIHNRSNKKISRGDTIEPVVVRITISDIYTEETIPNNAKREINELRNRWGTMEKITNIRNNYTNQKYFKPTEIIYKHSNQKKVKVNKNTELITKNLMQTKSISNIKPERRVYINKKSNVKNNKTLIRLYDKKGIHKYLMGKFRRRLNINEGSTITIKKIKESLHGEPFTINNVKAFRNGVNNVNQEVKNRNAFLRRVKQDIKNKIKNNKKININHEVERYKKNRPNGTTINDITNIIRNLNM